MSLLKYWTGSNWITIPDGSAVKYWTGSSWQSPLTVYYWTGSSWQPVWSKSDPLTLAFSPVWTNTYGEGHLDQPSYTMDPVGSSLFPGDWDSVGHPSGMQRCYAVMRFDSVAIASAFGGRNVVSDCRLRVTARDPYSGSGMYASVYTSTYGFTNTKPTSLSSAPQLGNARVSADRLLTGESVYLDFGAAVGNAILSNSIKAFVAYGFGGGTSEQAKIDYRGSLYDSTNTSTIRPRLEITADYV